MLISVSKTALPVAPCHTYTAELLSVFATASYRVFTFASVMAVRGTYKSEDGPIPVEPEMARSLKAKFENWANEIERENHKNSGLETEVEDFTPQLDTAKNLKAKFEAIKLENKPAEKPKPKVNRFVVSFAIHPSFLTCPRRRI